MDSHRNETLSRFEGVDRRFDAIDGRFEAINSRFDGIMTKLDGIETRLELSERVTFLESGEALQTQK